MSYYDDLAAEEEMLAIQDPHNYFDAPDDQYDYSEIYDGDYEWLDEDDEF